MFRYDGVYLRNVRLGTSWWPYNSHNPPNFNHHTEATDRALRWEREASFPRYTVPSNQDAWRATGSRFGISHRGKMFSRGNYHGSILPDDSDFVFSMPGEISQKSENSPPSSSPTHSSGHSTHSHSSTSPLLRQSSPTSLHLRASSHSSPTGSSLRRSRHVSIASSSSSSSLESTASESGNVKSCQSSSSLSAEAASTVLSPTCQQPHAVSPFVAKEDKKEVKLEGRVLRSHSSLHTRSSETMTRKVTSLSRSLAGPSVGLQREISSCYNTRSKKKYFEEREMASPNKKHHSSRRKGSDPVPEVEADNIFNYRSQEPSPPQLKSDEIRVSLESIVDSNSSPNQQKTTVKAAASGESSQSEEEIWVERKVEMRTGMPSMDEVTRSHGSFSSVEMSVHRPDREGKGLSISSPPLSHSRGVVEGPSLPATSLCVIDHYESQVTSTATPMQCQQPYVLDKKEVLELNSPLMVSGGGDGIPSMLSSKEAEGSGKWLHNCGDNEDLRSILMSPQEERDDTPPAELLEATHHLVQGKFSEWYRDHFKNDPQTLQGYLNYYQATEGKMSKKRGHKGDNIVQVASPSDKVVHLASDGGAGFINLSEVRCIGDKIDSMKVDIVSRKRMARSCCPLDLKKRRISSAESMERDEVRKSEVELTHTQEVKVGVKCDDNPPPSKDYNLEETNPLEPQISSPPPDGKADNSSFDLAITVLGEDREPLRATRRPALPRKVEEKYLYLQKHALRQFLLRSKPLILSTQTFIRYI